MVFRVLPRIDEARRRLVLGFLRAVRRSRNRTAWTALRDRTDRLRCRMIVVLAKNRRLAGAAVGGSLLGLVCLAGWVRWGAGPADGTASGVSPQLLADSADAQPLAPSALAPSQDALPETGFANKYLAHHNAPPAATEAASAGQGAWLTGTIEVVPHETITRAAHFTQSDPSRQ